MLDHVFIFIFIADGEPFGREALCGPFTAVSSTSSSSPLLPLKSGENRAVLTERRYVKQM